ncbi:MAG TPA: autotransporter-associated beta strand repeat-containing protein [Tepidisphaeraceae bacterium]|nr:autotransporter-associated beta strand repeat-containing protein [Tepidisphaeraceae bacterium]
MSKIETSSAGAARSRNFRQRRGLLAAAVAGVVVGGAWLSSARAGTFTWDINQSGNWTTPTSWVGGVAPTGADTTDNLIFGGVEGGSYTSTVDTIDPFAINGLTLNSSSTTTTQFIGFSNTQGISLGGTNPFITQNGTGAFQIDSPLIFAANTTFGGTGTGLTALNGAISGSGALTVNSGTWQITNANNSWTGGTTITGGTVELFSNGGDIGLLATGTTRLGTGGTLNINAATLGGQAELRFTSGLGKTLAGGASRPIIFGANGGQITVDGSIANGNAFTITTSNTAGAAPAVLRFNGGPNHLSNNNPNDGNWSNGNNALRLAITNAGPIRIELDQGAMFVMPNVATLNNPLTVRGVPGGDPTSGPDGLVHTGTSLTTGRLDLPNQGTYAVPGGLFLEGAIQTALEGAARAIDGNITVRGTASGNPGNVSFHGRGTGTNFGTGTLNAPGGTAAGHNVLYLGVGGNDTFTIEDGGTANLDLKIRTEVGFAHGVLVNAKTVLKEGGTLRVMQSISVFSPVTPAPVAGGVGYEIFQGNIEAQGSSAKESVINLAVPFKNTLIENSAFGGVEFQSTSNLIINGSGTGGLMVKGTSRPNALFSGGGSDPVSNADKVANLLSATRLQNLTGTGGYLTPAASEATFTMPAGGDWAASVPVGLKVIDSNTAGDDVALGGAFTHNVIIEAGATLNGSGNTLGPAAVTANLGLIKGTGTLANTIVNTGARLAPGNSIGTMNGSGTVSINGTYEADVTIAANDLFAMTGDLSLGVNSILDLPNTNTYDGVSPYTIATYSGNLLGAFSLVNNLPAGYIVDYGGGNNGSIRLTVPPPGSKIWTGATDGNWDTTTNNWLPSQFANGNDAIFDDSASGTTTVNIVSPVTPASVTVNNTTKAYTIGGAAITGATGLVKGFAGTLTLTGTNSFTGPVTIKNGVVSVAAISNTGVGGPLGAGSAINMGDVGSAGTLRFTGASGSTNRGIALTGLGGIIDTPSGSTLTLSGAISGSGGLTKINAGSLVISGNNAAGWSGPVILLGTGTTTASSAGALGTGEVTVGDGAATNSNVLNYNAAGAAGGSPGVTITTLSTLSVGANLGGSDRITVNPDAVISVNTFGASLDRNTNLNALDGAIVAENGAGRNNAVVNRGTNSDLYFGLAANVTDSMNLGTSPGTTSWKGLSTDALADRTLGNGSTITASSDFNLHSINGRKLILGSSGGGVTITGGPVNAHILSYVQLAGTASSYNGVNFDVHGGSTLELVNSTVLGSGVNRGTVAVENGGLLRVSNSTAANGNVNVLDGGVLDVSLPGLSGTGVITEQPGGIVHINNASGLTGTQLTGPGIGNGAVVRMAVDNITNINTVNGAAVFEIYGPGTTGTQNAGINLSNGGVLTNDSNDATFSSSTGLNIGAGGGTLAATTGKTLSHAGNITTTNPLTIGTNATLDGNAKLGTVALGGTLTAPITMGAGTLRVSGAVAAASTIDMVNGVASFVDGSVLDGTINTSNTGGATSVQIHAGHNGTTGNISGSGVINLSNGEDVVGFVDEVATGNPALINVVPTTIHVLNTGTLASDREGAASNVTGAIRFTDVRLHAGSDLTFQRITENVGAELTLLGNATIRGLTTGNAVRVGNINDNGAGYTLTTAGNQDMRIVGTLQGTTNIRATHSGTIQLNTTNFNPSYTSSFSLGGNTYNMVGAWDANVSGGPLPGLTGSGATTIGNDPGPGTFIVTGGTLNVNATAPNTTFIANGGRIIADRVLTMGTVNLATTAEIAINNANSVVTITNFNQSPHAALVIQPNADDSNPIGTAGLGITSKLLLPNNVPTVTNGMVSPSIVRKNNGNNEGSFLNYDTVNGFRTAPATSNQIDLDQPTTIVQLLGNDYVAPQSMTADRAIWALKTNNNVDGPGLTLTIGSGGIIFYNGGNGNATISANVDFGNTEAFIYGREGGGDFTTNPGNKNRDTFSGTVSGTAGLTKFGGGDIHFSGNNTLTGPITIHRGRIVIDGGTGLGTGNPLQGGDGRNNPLTINGNSATFNGNNNHHPSTFDLSGNLQSVDGINGNGGVTSSNVSAPLVIDKTAGTATFTGAIFGSVSIFKRGPGTQILAPGAYGDNTYTDGTTVEAGTLLVNNTTGSGTGSGSVFVNSGATLGGNGSIGAFVNVQNGGHLAPGSGPAAVGAFTLQGLGLDTGILDYEGDGSGVDRLNVGTDGFSLNGISTINVANLGGLGSGDFVIIDYSNGAPDLANFQLGPAPAGYTFSLLHDIDNTNILLHVVSSGPPQWNLDANGSWSIAANWIGGVPNAPGAVANFLGKITAPRTITLDGDKTVGTINFDNANKYTIAQGSGGTLFISGSAINVAANRTAEISAPLSLLSDTNITAASGGTLILSGPLSIAAGKSATKLGPGILTISGAQSHGAGTSLNVNNGRANLNSNLGTAASAGAAASHPTALNISAASAGDATAVTGADQNFSELSVATANAGLQGLDLATPAAPGAFRSIHVYAANLAAAKTALYSAIREAAINPGDGIFDSGLAAHSGAKLGLAQVADAHGDQNIFIRPTRIGDLNLDGQVTISDFIDLASHFNGSGTWQEGDLNYDGQITISDFIDLASNFNATYAGGSTPINPSDQLTLSNFASGIGVDPAVIGSAVPEPSTLSLLTIGVCALLPRRRRNCGK